MREKSGEMQSGSARPGGPDGCAAWDTGVRGTHVDLHRATRHAPKARRRIAAGNGAAASARRAKVRLRPARLLRRLVPEPVAQRRTGEGSAGSGGRAGVGRIHPEVPAGDERAGPEPRTGRAGGAVASHQPVAGLLLPGREPLPQVRVAGTSSRARGGRGGRKGLKKTAPTGVVGWRIARGWGVKLEILASL